MVFWAIEKAMATATPVVPPKPAATLAAPTSTSISATFEALKAIELATMSLVPAPLSA